MRRNLRTLTLLAALPVLATTACSRTNPQDDGVATPQRTTTAELIGTLVEDWTPVESVAPTPAALPPRDATPERDGLPHNGWVDVWMPAGASGDDALVVGRFGGSDRVLFRPDLPGGELPTAASPVTADDRMDPMLRRAMQSAPNAAHRAVVALLPVPGVDREALHAWCASAGCEVLGQALGVDRSVALVGSPDTLWRLAAEPWVRWLAAPLPVRALDETSAEWMNAPAVYPEGETGLDLRGDGVVLGIFDGGGMFEGHIDLAGRAYDVGREYILNCEETSSHATSVAGAAMGAGIGEARARGIAFGTSLILGWTFCGENEEKTRQNAPLFEASNHSYGSDAGWVWYQGEWIHIGREAFGKYDSDARRVDLAINETDEIWVFAAGNEGGNGPDEEDIPEGEPGPDCDEGIDCIVSSSLAKNAIIVAGVSRAGWDEETDERVLRAMNMSSRGPADDGRVRPDIGARGRDVRSPTLGGGEDYTDSSGTSLAAPAVTGAIALLVELYHRHRGGATPPSALIRGLLVHTAESYYPEGEPDPALGHGLMDIRAAAELLELELSGAEHRIATAVHGRRDRLKTWTIVGTPGQDLVVTLAWNDPAGEANYRGEDDPTPALVNDLDLEVVAPDETTHLPWGFDVEDRLARATRRANRVDNVERVWIPGDAVVDGEYEIRVRLNDRLFDSQDQRYWLFASAPISGDDEAPLRAEIGEGVVVRLEGGDGTAPIAVWASAPEATAWEIAGELPEWLSLSGTSGTVDAPPVVSVDPEAFPTDGDATVHTAFVDVTLTVDGEATTRRVGVVAVPDNCPLVDNPDQRDLDGDGVGDACDVCVAVRDPDQRDADDDGRGDACDTCPELADPDPVDADFDAVGDTCDVCPGLANADQTDSDGDGVGDACTDTDEDGVVDGPVRALTVALWTPVVFDLLPDFETLGPPNYAFAASDVAWPGTGGAVVDNPWGIRDAVAVAVSGHIRIPTTGEYTFYLTSDDGSRLFVDGTELVLNDGLHGMITQEGATTLSAGMHAVRIELFERYGGAGLQLEWAGPGFDREFVPATAFEHVDNCPTTPNADQLDGDGDGIGDACDTVDPEPNSDVGTDTAEDATPDTGDDSGTDVATDSGLDATQDGGEDADDDTSDDSGGDASGAGDAEGSGGGGRGGGCATVGRSDASWTGVVLALALGLLRHRRRRTATLGGARSRG